MPQYNIAIVEDNVLLGNEICAYISKFYPAVLYLNGSDFLADIKSGGKFFDLVLLDISLPDMSGVDIIKEIKGSHPDTEILMHTVNEDTASIINSIENGASGYVLKGTNPAQTMEAIETVMQGGSFLTPKIARKILNIVSKSTQKESEHNLDEYNLTHREKEILQEVIHGLTDREIAQKLDMSIHTVNMHLRGVYKKMQVNSRLEVRSKFNL